MRAAVYEATFELEEASRASDRWVYNKPRKLLLQRWLTDGLQTKQDEAKATYKRFLDEVDENIAHLPSKEAVLYLKEVKRILCSKRRYHQGILTKQRSKIADLEKQCLQLKNGTTYQNLAWNEVYAILSTEVDEPRSVREKCAEGKDCDGCDSCQYWADSILLKSWERYDFRTCYTIAIGATAFWQAGLNNIKERLTSLAPLRQPKVSEPKNSKPKGNLWEGILTPNFTLRDLNHTLVLAGILKDEKSLSLSSWAKKGCWPGVFDALVDMQKIPQIKNKTKLFEAIIFQYGREATSKSTIGTYNLKNKHSKWAYITVRKLNL